MILDMEKVPPPPYHRDAGLDLRLQNARMYSPSLTGIPPHLLLQIVYWTCPECTSSEERRASLYWICSSLRYTSRDLWIGESLLPNRSLFPDVSV